jgi:hypothetical protein
MLLIKATRPGGDTPVNGSVKHAQDWAALSRDKSWCCLSLGSGIHECEFPYLVWSKSRQG